MLRYMNALEYFGAVIMEDTTVVGWGNKSNLVIVPLRDYKSG
jgi:hypothetical protein